MIRVSAQPKWIQALVGFAGYLAALMAFVGAVIIAMAIDPPRSEHVRHNTTRANIK